MKIGIISDSHFSFDKAPRLAQLKSKALVSVLDEIDCLIMCGDNAEWNPGITNHRKLFDTIRQNTSKPVAFVEGNHELFGPELVENVTFNELKRRFRQYSLLGAEFTMIHLEEQNLMVEDITIAGTYGHYDGTLAGKELPIDYKAVSQLVKNLEKKVEGKGRKIMITHSVPTKTMIGRPDGPVQNRYTPYAGSTQLEDSIQRIKPNWHFCGHTHAYAHSKINGTLSYNVGTDYHDFFYFVLDTRNSSVMRKERKLNE